jgi:hypothetical protein
VKRIFILLSIFLSLRAYGQLWEPVVESDDGSVYSYDPTTVKREGDIVTYWELSDYSKPLKSGRLSVISSKSKITQDCKNNRYKVGDLIDYDGHKGTGNIVNVAMATETNWYIGQEGSVNEVMKNFLCKK